MLGTVLSSKYRLVAELGGGAMGVVYLAELVSLPTKKFAVKMLTGTLANSPEFRERFFLEAKRQAALEHPNIVSVIDYFEEAGHLFMVLDYVDGKPLDKIIEEKGALAEKEALKIFDGVLEGLDYAHQSGVIHRDVKPSNVLVRKSGQAVLLDFGIALQVGDRRLTGTGVNVGTPAYMSPEQIRHPMDIDHRTDVYSAGVVLFEMLTGRLPFDAQTEFDIKEQHVKSPPPDPRSLNPAVSERLARIVLKALRKDPNERFAGCGDFLREINAYQTGGAQTASKSKWIIAVVPVVAVAVAAGWYMTRSPQPPPAPVPAEPPPAKTTAIAPTPVPTPKPDTPVPTPKSDTPPSPPEKTGPRSRPTPGTGERESVKRLILAATQTAKMLCRETKTLEFKKAGRQHAETIGNSALVDQFAGQVSDLTNNLKTMRNDYMATLSNLRDSDRSVVDGEFEDQVKGAGAVTTDPLYVQAVQNSYRRMLAGNNPLPQDCLVD